MNLIGKTIDEYYQTYNKRQDIDKLLTYYDDEVLLEDIINGDRIKGKAELKSFLDWGNPDFKLLEGHTLIVQDKIIDKDKAVLKGYFTQFQWGETVYERMHFTTILYFNDSGRIYRHVDWINYPSNLIDYSSRKNSNNWIE